MQRAWQVMVLTHDKVLLAEVPYLRRKLIGKQHESVTRIGSLVQAGTQEQIGVGLH